MSVRRVMAGTPPQDPYGNPFPNLRADEPGAPGAQPPAPGAPGTVQPPVPGSPAAPTPPAAPAVPTVPPVTPPGTPGGIQGTGTVQGVGGTGTVMVPPPPPPGARPGYSGAPGTGLDGQPVPPPAPAPAPAPAPRPTGGVGGAKRDGEDTDPSGGTGGGVGGTSGGGGGTGTAPGTLPGGDPTVPGGGTGGVPIPGGGGTGGTTPPTTPPTTVPPVAVPTAPTGTTTLTNRPTFGGYRPVGATPSQDWRGDAAEAVDRFTAAGTPDFRDVAAGTVRDEFGVGRAAGDVLTGPDRLALAQQALALFDQEQEDSARTGTSAILDRAASAGRLGMGQTGEQIQQFQRQLARDRAQMGNQLARDFANVSVTDRINRLGALSDVEQQRFGQGLTTRQEDRGERASEFEQALARAGLLGNQAQTAQQFGQQSFLNDATLRNEARGEQDRSLNWQSTDFDAQMRRAALEEMLTSGDWNRYLAATTAARGQNIFSGFANPFNTGA